MDVFPTSLSRRNLFRAELTAVAASITVGYAFQKPEEAASSAASPDAQAVLKLATEFTIQNLIPFKIGFWDNEFGYAELLLRPQSDGNPTDWSLRDAVNESDRTQRLSLKEGIIFRNDNPLGADQSVALMTWHLANNKIVMEQFPGATAVVDQDKSLLLATQAPIPGLRNILADETCSTVFDPSSYEDTGDDPRKLIDAKIYTGPYTPVSLSDEKPMMAANPIYRNGIPGLGGIEVLFISNVGARIKTVQNREVDITLYPPTQQAKSLEGDIRAKFGLSKPNDSSLCLTINVAKSVFAEAKVRRALLRFIDYKTLATNVIQGFYEPASSFYDPKLPCTTDIWKTGAAEAEQLLDEMGTTKSDSGWLLSSREPIVFKLLTYPQQLNFGTLALALQAQSKEHGIQATIQQVSDTTTEMESNNWDIGAVSNGTVSFGGNPIPPLQRYHHTGGNRSYSYTSDPELDALINELATTPNEAMAKDLLVKIR